MKTILTIFKKEFKDITRDRRSMMMMFIIPMLLFPLLFTIAAVFTTRQAQKVRTKTLEVALITNGNAEAFRETLLKRDDLKIREDIAEDIIPQLIRSDSIDAAIRFDEQFDAQITDLQRGQIHLYFKSSRDMDASRNRLTSLIRDYENQIVNDRFQRLALDRTIVDPVQVKRHDIASQRERIGKSVGGFLPYIFVIMCFMGCMYPALDLGAGEKERATLETLLVAPVSKIQILLGKCGVIVLSGFASIANSFIGFFIAVMLQREIVARILEALQGMFEISSILLVLSLCLPLTIFFAAALMSVSIFAKSFKEAQSIMAPLNIIIIIPVFIGLLPGIELNAITSLIPVLNVSLASKEIFAGTIKLPLLFEVYASLIALAALSLYGCARWFERESTIFRET